MKPEQFIENVITATGYHSSHRGRYRHADGTPYGSRGLWRVMQSPTLQTTIIVLGGTAVMAVAVAVAASTPLVRVIPCIGGTFAGMSASAAGIDHLIRRRLNTAGVIDTAGERASQPATESWLRQNKATATITGRCGMLCVAGGWWVSGLAAGGWLGSGLGLAMPGMSLAITSLILRGRIQKILSSRWTIIDQAPAALDRKPVKLPQLSLPKLSLPAPQPAFG